MAPGFLSGSLSWRAGYWATGSLLSPCSSPQSPPCLSILLRRAAWGSGHSDQLMLYGFPLCKGFAQHAFAVDQTGMNVEIKQQGHPAASHLDQLGFIRTYLIIASHCLHAGSEWGLQGRIGTYIHSPKNHSGLRKGDLTGNTSHICWLFSTPYFTWDYLCFMFRLQPQFIFFNCNQPAVFLMHCHLL